MASVEIGKRWLAAMALVTGACLASSCATTSPSAGDDWRSLRRIDLPAGLMRVTWSDESYLSAGHPMQFGRTAVAMQAAGAAGASTVRATNNAADGLLVDNLTCSNAVRGEGRCALLLDQPNRCYLVVYTGAGNSASEGFEVDCPAYLQLER